MTRSSYVGPRARDAVYDTARGFTPPPLRGGGAHIIEMHRTPRDRQAPRSVVTGQILGDPAPGRSAQDRYEAALHLT